MGMEKRGTTTQHDIRELIKMADDEEKLFVVSMDNYVKYANGKNKAAVIVVATGERASMLRDLIERVSE